MKIAFLHEEDANNIRKWSGLPYFILKSLRKKNISVNNYVNYKISFIELFKKAFYKFLFHKYYTPFRRHNVIKKLTQNLDRVLDKDTDFILSAGSITAAHLNTNLPIIIWADATFAQLKREYPEYSRMAKICLKEGEDMERLALQKATLIVVASKYAFDSVVNDYGIDPNKVKIIKFGANLLEYPDTDTVDNAINMRNMNKMNFLLVGVDWDRKGGNKALAVVKKLNELGFKAKLSVLGCKPIIADEDKKYVIEYGFIDKSIKENRLIIQKIFLDSHFLIVPSKSEAYGLVFAEASAHGLPSISHRLGGIPSVVQDNVNGKLFGIDESINEIVSYITNLASNSDEYISICKSSYQYFNQELNWETAVSRLISEFENRNNNIK